MGGCVYEDWLYFGFYLFDSGVTVGSSMVVVVCSLFLLLFIRCTIVGRSRTRIGLLMIL